MQNCTVAGKFSFLLGRHLPISKTKLMVTVLVTLWFTAWITSCKTDQSRGFVPLINIWHVAMSRDFGKWREWTTSSRIIPIHSETFKRFLDLKAVCKSVAGGSQGNESWLPIRLGAVSTYRLWHGLAFCRTRRKSLLIPCPFAMLSRQRRGRNERENPSYYHRPEIQAQTKRDHFSGTFPMGMLYL